MNLHLPTLYVAVMAAYVALVALLSFTGLGRLRRNPALRDWTLGAWACTLAMVSYLIRPSLHPDVAVILSNGMSLCGACLYASAIHRLEFDAAPAPPLRWVGAAVLALVLSLTLLDWPTRVIVACLAHALVLAMGVVWILRGPQTRRAGLLGLSVILACAIAALLLRAADAWAHPQVHAYAAMPGLRQGITLVLPMACLIGAGFAFVLACFERLAGEMEHLARHDGLTGCLNRAAGDAWLELRLAEAVQRAQPLALVVMDVDHFKQVNDRHGHHVGDRVLRSLACTLQAQLGPADRCVRLGGEEFGLILPDCDLALARHRAEILRAAVALSQVLDDAGERIDLSVSVGVAVALPQRPVSASRLYIRADAALYRAKHAGRNRVEHSVQSAWSALG